jgi:hypothetical protein
MTGTVKFAVAWLALAAILASILGGLNLPTLLRLAQRGERSTATIIQPSCDNHSSASYTFIVGSTYYSGNSIMWMVDCRSLRPGDSIVIYYDNADPRINRAVEPRAGIVNELIPIALACLIVPPAVIGLLSVQYRRMKAKWSS